MFNLSTISTACKVTMANTLSIYMGFWEWCCNNCTMKNESCHDWGDCLNKQLYQFGKLVCVASATIVYNVNEVYCSTSEVLGTMRIHILY